MLPQRSPDKYGGRSRAVTIPFTRRCRNASTSSFNGSFRKSSIGRSRGKRPPIKSTNGKAHQVGEKATYELETPNSAMVIAGFPCRGSIRAFQPSGRYLVAGSPPPPNKVGGDQVWHSRRGRANQANGCAWRRSRCRRRSLSWSARSPDLGWHH